MTFLHYILASWQYFARLHFAAALGAAIAAAVLTGALLVGDSMRGSLRDLTLDRLGRIEELLLTEQFFRAELAIDIASHSAFQRSGYTDVVGAIIAPAASAEHRTSAGTVRAGGLTLLGINGSFSALQNSSPVRIAMPKQDEVILNEPLASELAAQVGDRITLRLPSAENVPAESALGKKESVSRSLIDLKVTAIVPAQGLGRFSLRAQQTAPKNAYVALASVQETLECAGKINAVFVAGAGRGDDASSQSLAEALQPRLEDYELSVRRLTRKFQEETLSDQFQFGSDRMLIDQASERSLLKTFAAERPRAVLSYLANRIERIPNDETQKKAQERIGPISYSIAAAIDLGEEEGGPLGEHEIALNQWAAEDQQVTVGDRVRITYFEPESTHGTAKEAVAEMTVARIVPLTVPQQGYRRDEPAVYEARPLWANDPDLTPEVKGVTDQDSIDRWEAPFPVDYKIVRSQDDDYWADYRTTPKAYVSLAAGRKLWRSRWGETTAIRIDAAEGASLKSIAHRATEGLRRDGVSLGFEFQPIRRRDLAASQGTTPFDVLFLALSFFLMASALMLTALLFRLSIERRASEIGLLTALGFEVRKVRRLLACEGLITAALGSFLGTGLGFAYGALLLLGLRTWWLGAIASPFLTFHWSLRSLVVGCLLGILASLAAMWWAIRSLHRTAPRALLAGRTESDPLGAKTGRSRYGRLITIGCLAAAIPASLAAFRLGGEAQAGAFLAAGALALGAGLSFIRERWLSQASRSAERLSLWELARTSVRRNPSRSLLTLALTASAGFLIVALSAFRLQPTLSGSGGYTLIAESSQGLRIDWSDAAQIEQTLGDEAKLLPPGDIAPFRVKPGDDAGCRNLYQAAQPRIVGISETFIARYDTPAATPFLWAGSAAKSPEERSNPWRLFAHASSDEAVAVAIDKNTAMYGLKIYRGVGEEFTIRYGARDVRFRVTALLEGSVFQGSLLIGEADFLKLFPESSGSRLFLIAASPEKESQLTAVLEERLGDQGFDVRRCADLLAEFSAVQNTYLSTFQTLGLLSLLLGACGLAAAQLRGVWERRGELALLRAIGFSQSRLLTLILLENASLLALGLLLGTGAALITVLPHMSAGGAQAPLRELLPLMAATGAAGYFVSRWALQGTLRSSLVGALRGE